MSAQHVNGTAAAVAWPIKTDFIKLDEIGYVGWKVEIRLNPRAELWDAMLNASPNADKVWEAFSAFIIGWNFGDEKGNALPLPPETKRSDLPIEVPTYLINTYVDMFNKASEFPKAPASPSSDTSQTKKGNQGGTSA